VVCEYLDVFLEELLGMPPDRDIDFSIELLLDIAPLLKDLIEWMLRIWVS
jgi:hypothetical protein